MALRSGVSVNSVIDQLKGIRSPKIGWDEQDQIYSIPDGIATALERYMNGDLEVEPPNQVQISTKLEDALEETSVAENTPESSTSNVSTDNSDLPPEEKKCPLCKNYSVILYEGCKKCSRDDCPFSLC
jgi:ribonucleoside-diphosphate reductase alpha chain